MWRATPGGPNSFNFMQFLRKFGKIVCWRPFRGLAPRSKGKSWIRHWERTELSLKKQNCLTRRKTGQHASSVTDLCVFNNQKECSQKSYQILCLNFLKFLKEVWFVSFAGQKQIRNMRCHQNDVIDDASGKRRNDRKCRLILGPPDVLIFSFIRISSFLTSCKKILYFVKYNGQILTYVCNKLQRSWLSFCVHDLCNH